MTVSQYNKAVQMLRESDTPIFSPGGSSQLEIDSLEKLLLVKLPASYRAMLAEFGILGFRGKQFYGLGKSGLDGAAVPNVVFATQSSRLSEEISKGMVRIMASGYGPDFVIDCGQLDQRGEGPVYEVNELGYRHGMKKVADSFGEFLLKEVNTLLENQ